MPFRARAGAAPLKPDRPASAELGDGVPFRARAGAAPLKQQRLGWAPVINHAIPRPPGRGPVEAAVRSAHLAVAMLPFRARAGAAPLKPCRSPPPLSQMSPFRARAGAAPLKQACPLRAQFRQIVHSAPARARPR